MTFKQKLAAKKITETHGNISKAMLLAGYSPETASKPSNLTESKGWNELMDKYLPDADILRVHKEALSANKILSAKILVSGNEQTDDFIEVPDHPTRLKAVELSYKVKKKIGDPNTLVQVNNPEDMSVIFE